MGTRGARRRRRRAVAIGVVVFVWPTLAVDHGAWDVTPPTARVVASLTALNVGSAAASLDGRRLAIRIPALSQCWASRSSPAGSSARDELHADRPATWIDVGALATILALLACLLATTSSRADAPPSSPMRV